MTPLEKLYGDFTQHLIELNEEFPKEFSSEEGSDRLPNSED